MFTKGIKINKKIKMKNKNNSYNFKIDYRKKKEASYIDFNFKNNKEIY
jgi:hypothetical protein